MWFPVEVEWMQRGRERGHWLPAVEDCSVETSVRPWLLRPSWWSAWSVGDGT